MLKKLTPLLLSLCALPMATSSAWAQSSIEDLDSEGDKKKAKAKKSARTSAESDEVIREIERGLYIKAGMGTTAYLLNYGSGVLRSGTTLALTAGQDFVAAFTVANDLGLPVDFPQGPGLFVDTNNRQDIVFARETP